MFELISLGAWPSCIYDKGKTLRCGDPETRALYPHAGDVEIVRRGWHIADTCDCPSCPLRVAIREAIQRAEP